jgi:hypothetical protein
MNTKTFIILFLLGISCSCSMTYEYNFGGEQPSQEKENGTSNK